MKKLDLEQIRTKIMYAVMLDGMNAQISNFKEMPELFSSVTTDRFIVAAICQNPECCKFIDLDYPGQKEIVNVLVEGVRERKFDKEAAIIYCMKIRGVSFTSDEEAFVNFAFDTDVSEELLNYAIDEYIKKKYMRDKLMLNDLSFMNYADPRLHPECDEICIGITPSLKFQKMTAEQLYEEIAVSDDDLYGRHPVHYVTEADASPIEGYWTTHIAENNVTMIVGASKTGKSTFALNLAYHIQNGVDFLEEPVKKGKVLYVDFENAENIIQARRSEIQKQLGFEEDIDIIADIGQDIHYFDTVSAEIRSQEKRGNKYDVLIFDNWYSFFDGDNENDSAQVAKFLREKIGAFKKDYAVIYIHHTNKSTPKTKIRTVQDVIDYGGGSGTHGKFASSVIAIERVSNTGPECNCFVAGRNVIDYIKYELTREGFVFKFRPFSGMTPINDMEVINHINTYYPETCNKIRNEDKAYTLRGLNSDLKKKGDIYNEFIRDQDKIQKRIGEEDLGAKELRIIGFVYDYATKRIAIPG